MKKLENIPKKNIYQVPDGYFDKLPGMIQARVAEERVKPQVTFSWINTLKYAFPVLLIAGAGFFWYIQTTGQPTDPGAILATVDTDDLVAYINTSDLSTDELLDAFALYPEEVADIENEVYGNLYDEELDTIIDEFDIDLNNL